MPVSPSLAYADAVAVTNTYLAAALTAAGRTTRVVSRIPSDRPVELVKATLTGGVSTMPMVDAAQITFDCWAATPPAATSLALLVRRLVMNMAGTVQSTYSVHTVTEVGGPSDLPDPVSNTPRVVFTVLVQIRGKAA